MRIRERNLLAAILLQIYACSFPAPLVEAEPALKLVPWPKTVAVGRGVLRLSAESRILADDRGLLPLANVVADEIRRTTGMRLVTGATAPRPGDIVLATDPSLEGEAYRLEVTDRLTVGSGTYGGVASGTATLLQLMQETDGVVTIPRLTIRDEPSYAFRSAMIDLARKYHSPGGIRQVIDLCRMYKIRYLHVHLSDDQLFMFPSRRFPTLGKGNWEFARFEPASKPHISPYTRDELVALERYAAARGVHMIPEIDMPGHAGRLVGDAPDVFGFPGSGSTLNIASRRALEAATALWNEVMDVFQSSPYVHLGGDEVGLGGLEKTPDFKDLQRRFPQIRNAHDLYRKFIADMHGVFAARSKQMIVWEEAYAADGPFPLPKDSVVMVWCRGRNPADIVRHGYTVVNATWTPLYIVRDNRKPVEFLFNWNLAQFGREGSEDFVTLKETSRLAGAQLCSWENSESIEIQSMRQRLAIVAEKSWNPDAGRDFADFSSRWAHTDAVLDDLVHPIKVDVTGKLRDEIVFEEPISIGLTVKRDALLRWADRAGEREDVAIRYTLGNDLPGATWKPYVKPIRLEKAAHLRAGLFDASGRQCGELVGGWFVARVPVKPNLATRKPVTVGPGPDRSDAWGAKAAVDGRVDDVWGHWASSDPAPQWLQIDLEDTYPIEGITVRTYYDGSRYYHLNAEVSVDGKTWKKVFEWLDTIPATAEGYSGTCPRIDARYVRVNMLKNSANPYVHIVEVIVDKAGE